MAAQATARASPELREAPLSPRYSRNYTTSRGTTAGSGKTYAIANSVTNRKALFLTPTHAARTVLEQELNGQHHEVMTIHSAIGWHKSRDEDLEPVESYRPAKKATSGSTDLDDKGPSPFAKADLIIVDEFSMVGSFLFGAIEEYAEQFSLPVVYSGDRFQLPPVRDREVITQQGFPTITLTESMRFSKDSEIFQLGEMLRDSIENRPDEELSCLLGRGDVHVVPGDVWMVNLTSGYARGDNLLAVASDNATLRRVRQKVRQVDHERLCLEDIVMSKQTDEQFRNGEQFTIRGVERGIRELLDVPNCVSSTRILRIEGDALSFHETEKTAFILDHEKDASKLSKRIQSLYRKGKLSFGEASRILDWVDEINRFELAALATVHKSQGRSVDTVYVDTGTVLRKPNWLSCVDHKRLLYTAITRPRKQVVFYEMPTFCEAETEGLARAA